MKLYHIFKLPPNQREAVCGLVAKSEPKADRESYPRCEACMAWFKSICWKAEPASAKENENG